MTTITLTVNGEQHSADAEPRLLLADFLREKLGLTGTHVGCEHGVCGACTVHLNGQAARSCLMFAVQAQGATIATIEGLASADGTMHPLQALFAKHQALQCGFCTPGMLMTALDLVATHGPMTEAQVREGMSAVLCRCTGYAGMVAAVVEYAASKPLGEYAASKPLGESAASKGAKP